MMQKLCPGCGKYSYSAAAEGEWICPYCGENITKEPAEADPPVFAKIPEPWPRR